MFKNKHIVIALIIAPILALISYFATDRVVSEKPHAALAGQSYKLMAKPNCRYASGSCTLINGDVKITLRAETPTANRLNLLLNSSVSLAGARIALAASGEAGVPVEMSSSGTGSTRWQAQLQIPAPGESTIRLAIAAGQSIYYAETGLAFVNP